jgi:hypothetical protein
MPAHVLLQILVKLKKGITLVLFYNVICPFCQYEFISIWDINYNNHIDFIYISIY